MDDDDHIKVAKYLFVCLKTLDVDSKFILILTMVENQDTASHHLHDYTSLKDPKSQHMSPCKDFACSICYDQAFFASIVNDSRMDPW